MGRSFDACPVSGITSEYVRRAQLPKKAHQRIVMEDVACKVRLGLNKPHDC